MLRLRRCILAAAALLLQHAAIAQAPAAPGAERPNALIIVLDRVGTGDVGFLGSSLDATPHLDALASRGVVLQRAYAASPQPSPARAAILTGRWPNALGFEFAMPMGEEANAPDAAARGLVPGTPTIGSQLAAGGWTTGFVGSWQMGVTAEQAPMSMGFGFDCFVAHATRTRKPRPGKDDGFSLRSLGAVNEDFERLEDAMTACATGFIERERSKPWLLVVALPGLSPPLSPTNEDLAAFPQLDGRRRDMAASLRALDRSIGAMLTAVETTGQTARTMVVVIGDTGGSTAWGSSNGTLHGDFGTCFEGGLRVPMLMALPSRITPGSTYPHPVTGADVLPTVAAALGQAPPTPIDGVNLLPFLAGASSGLPHAELHWQAGQSAATMFSGLKYVIPLDGAPSIYRIDQDPTESINGAEDSVDAYTMLRERHERWSQALPPARWLQDGTIPEAQRAPAPPPALPDPGKRRAPKADPEQ
jgi:arylsulfatase A-like enzyme